MAAVWFSQPAVLVAAGLGIALLVSAMMSPRKAVAAIACVVAAWGVSVVAVVAASFHHLTPVAHRFLYEFWNDGFWPLSLRDVGSWVWPLQRVAKTLREQLALPTQADLVLSIFAAVGAWATWRRDRRTAMLLLSPLLVTLVASVAQLYPFKERLVLFLIPSLLLLVTVGFTALAEALRLKRLPVVVIAAATLIFIALDARALRASPPVYKREEITPAIEHLRAFREPADECYIYYGAVPAFVFYAPRAGFGPSSYVPGGCHRGDSRAYLSELDAFRGRARVWVLFSHELPRLREREPMVRYLNSIGTMRDSMVAGGHDVNGQPTSVFLYRYDLSDSARLRSADARTFPIPAQPPVDVRLRCAPEDE
jgi:hypothetical protein